MYYTKGVLNLKTSNLNSVFIGTVVCDLCAMHHSTESTEFYTVKGNINKGLAHRVAGDELYGRHVIADSHYCINCLLQVIQEPKFYSEDKIESDNNGKQDDGLNEE